MRSPLRPALVAVLVAAAALVAGAAPASALPPPPPPPRAAARGAAAARRAGGAPASAAMTVHGSVEGAYVVGAKRGDRVAVQRAARTVRTGRADRFGAKVFIDLRPGA